MAHPVYYVEAGDTLPIFFDTFDGGTGASITLTGLAVTDIEIYKDGSVTQRASDAGYTLLDTDGIDFDGVTGIHGFSLDLSDNTDTGFYAVGSWYHVVVSSVTVDAQTVNFIAAAFRIVSATRGMAGTALPDAAADAAGGLPISDAGALDLDVLNTNVSSILTDTGTTLDNHLTDIKGTGFVKDTHSLVNIEGYVDLIDDGTSGLAKIATDAAAILVDTAEIGTAGAGLTNINLPDQTMNITGNITGNLSGSVGSVTGNVGGSVASVTGAINTAAGTITTLDALDTAQDSQHGTTQTKVDTAQADLDILTGTDGVTLATSQGNYAPATAAALATVDGIVDNLNLGIIYGTAQTGTLTTTVMTSDLTGYADDELIGRVIVWTGGTANGQASDITDYASASGTLTYTAITTAPLNGDSFKIV